MFVVDELAALGMDRIKVACFAARKAVEINYSTCYMKIDSSLNRFVVAAAWLVCT